jgi:two-component system NtrC family sensor kinase
VRLVVKLTLAFFLASCIVVAFNAVRRVRRDTELYLRDQAADRRLVAATLAASVGAVLERTRDPSEARTMIQAANALHERVTLAWVCGDGAVSPAVRCADLETIPGGATRTHDTVVDGRKLSRTTYAPVYADGVVRGAVTVSESTEPEIAFRDRTIRDSATTALMLGALFSVMSFALGFVIVGRPTAKLIDKARRIAGGDLEGSLVLRQHDELGALAMEIDAMCQALARSRARLEAEMQARAEALTQLRHADRLALLGRMAAGIAHELATPLNTLQARAEMLAELPDASASLTEHRRAMLESAERMTVLLRQLLEFAGNRPADRIVVDARELAERAVRMVEPMAKRGGVAVEVASGSEPIEARVDPLQLEQVFGNVLVNAIQATPPGGNVRVELSRGFGSLGEGDDMTDSAAVIVEVIDTGHGIKHAELSRVFEPFFTTRPPGQGTGLGLSVCYGIVHEHGGRIVIENRVSAGAKVRIELPSSGISADGEARRDLG